MGLVKKKRMLEPEIPELIQKGFLNGHTATLLKAAVTARKSHPHSPAETLFVWGIVFKPCLLVSGTSFSL